MSLQLPNLCDKDFKSIVSETISAIPKYTPRWPNHNPSDLGITIVELFGWVIHNTLYQMNTLPETLYVNFLRLVAGGSGEDIIAMLFDKNHDDIEHRNLLRFLADVEGWFHPGSFKKDGLKTLAKRLSWAKQAMFTKENNPKEFAITVYEKIKPEFPAKYMQTKFTITLEGENWKFQDDSTTTTIPTTICKKDMLEISNAEILFQKDKQTTDIVKKICARIGPLSQKAKIVKEGATTYKLVADWEWQQSGGQEKNPQILDFIINRVPEQYADLKNELHLWLNRYNPSDYEKDAPLPLEFQKVLIHWLNIVIQSDSWPQVGEIPPESGDNKLHRNRVTLCTAFPEEICALPERKSVSEMQQRAIQFLRAPYRVITKNDFHLLAENICYLDENTLEEKQIHLKRIEIQTVPDEGKITLIVIPEPGENYEKMVKNDSKNDSNDYTELVSRVDNFFKQRVVIGTRLEVKMYTCIKIAIHVIIECYAYANPEIVKEQAKQMIEAYLHPISGGPDKTGYPYNRGLKRYAIENILLKIDGLRNVTSVQLQGKDEDISDQEGIITLTDIRVNTVEKI